MRVVVISSEPSIARNIVAGLPADVEAILAGPGDVPPLDADTAIFFGDALSRQWRDAYRRRGVFVIDHSTDARMDPRVPSVVPQVNPDALLRHPGLVASPNCASVMLAAALGPLHAAFGLRRAVITTLQAISGAGDEAAAQYEAEAAGGGVGAAFPKPMARNLHARIPQAQAPRDDGLTAEEAETADEIRRILGDGDLRISATCVRVPVRNAHGISVHLELATPASPAQAEAVLAGAPCIKVWSVDDFPTPLEVDGEDDVHVGRIRLDSSVENGLALFLVGDNLRRGTALNAVDIFLAWREARGRNPAS